jgi:hypothetical protein
VNLRRRVLPLTRRTGLVSARLPRPLRVARAITQLGRRGARSRPGGPLPVALPRRSLPAPSTLSESSGPSGKGKRSARGGLGLLENCSSRNPIVGRQADSPGRGRELRRQRDHTPHDAKTMKGIVRGPRCMRMPQPQRSPVASASNPGATEKESPRQALGPTICAMAESWSELTRSRRVGSTHELEQLRMIGAGYRGRWRVVG